MATKERCIPEWYGTLEVCSATASVFANVLVALLVVFRTPKELKVYRRVLLCNCVVDLFYTTVSYMIELVGTGQTHGAGR